jgi:hypothetical protein
MKLEVGGENEGLGLGAFGLGFRVQRSGDGRRESGGAGCKALSLGFYDVG